MGVLSNDNEDTINEGNLKPTTNDELHLQVEKIIERKKGVWICKICGKTSAHKSNIRGHSETHIGGMSHACDICSKTFPNHPCLRGHISRIHTELFSCNICGKTGMNKMAYINHKRRHHKVKPQNQ